MSATIFTVILEPKDSSASFLVTNFLQQLSLLLLF